MHNGELFQEFHLQFWGLGLEVIDCQLEDIRAWHSFYNLVKDLY